MTEEGSHRTLIRLVGRSPKKALRQLTELEACPQKVLDEALNRLAWWGESHDHKPWTDDHEALVHALQEAGANADPSTQQRLAIIAERRRKAEQKARLRALARAGDLAGVQALIKTMKSWETDVREIALLEATHGGQATMVAALLDAGAHPDAVHGCYTSSDYDTPLHAAAARRDTKIVALLLAHGADVNVVRRKSGATPLYAVLRGGYEEATHLPLVRALLDAGADPNLPRGMLDFDTRGKNENLRTVLQLAIARGARQTVQLLLEHGADIDRRDSKQQTALTLVVR
ncbi:MAG: ankyrin repeat domain-containing protein, partial [Chloroflexota bacterium]|nr:ankyrin repeat domain-containing protein [Chloroflexota bacterium]